MMHMCVLEAILHNFKQFFPTWLTFSYKVILGLEPSERRVEFYLSSLERQYARRRCSMHLCFQFEKNEKSCAASFRRGPLRKIRKRRGHRLGKFFGRQYLYACKLQLKNRDRRQPGQSLGYTMSPNCSGITTLFLTFCPSAQTQMMTVTAENKEQKIYCICGKAKKKK